MLSTSALVREVRAENLSAKLRCYLRNFMRENPLPEGDEGLAIGIVANDSCYFVVDARLPTKKRGVFGKEAPKELHCIAATGFIRTKHGLLAVSDERRNHFKPFPAGLSKYSEGHDPATTFWREFHEEVFIFDHLKRSALFVPPRGKPKLRCESLDVTVNKCVEIGQIRPLGLNLNVGAYGGHIDMQFEWDIRELDTPFSVFYDEDEWFMGGRPGIPVVALDRYGNVAGWFAGQQGFVSTKWGLHNGVEDYLAKH